MANSSSPALPKHFTSHVKKKANTVRANLHKYDLILRQQQQQQQRSVADNHNHKENHVNVLQHLGTITRGFFLVSFYYWWLVLLMICFLHSLFIITHQNHPHNAPHTDHDCLIGAPLRFNPTPYPPTLPRLTLSCLSGLTGQLAIVVSQPHPRLDGFGI